MQTWILICIASFTHFQRSESRASTGILQPPSHSTSLNESISTVKVGKTVNIFPRYGSFVHTMKIWPTTMSDSLSSEETMTILDNKHRVSPTRMIKGPNIFEDDFLIDFCDDEDNLLSKFFDHFEVEGVQKAYKAFTSFSSVKGLSRALGIHSSFWGKQHSFVLVRLYKRKKREILNNQLHLRAEFVDSVKKIRTGSSASAHSFMDDFGSHIIVDYEVGDMFYQVFVFGKHVYNEMKKNFFVHHSTLGQTPSVHERKRAIQDYFTPYFALHIGQVKLASGHPKFKEINEKLETRYFVFRLYESIFNIKDNKELENTINELDGEAIIGLKLKKITRLLRFSPEAYWLRIILDNTLSLYYTTIR